MPLPFATPAERAMYLLGEKHSLEGFDVAITVERREAERVFEGRCASCPPVMRRL